MNYTSVDFFFDTNCIIDNLNCCAAKEDVMPILLSTNLDDPASLPYFLWDEPISVGELRHRLRPAPRRNVCACSGASPRNRRTQGD